MNTFYQVAQLNTGRILAPIDSPAMSGFVSQLDAINALADQNPDFVWRLQTESGNATSVQAYEDPTVLINMSVWKSVEALKTFVYQTAHVGPLRDRLKWFEKPKEAHMVLWWVPAGHIPSVAEARERLDFYRRHGESLLGFSFAKPQPPPDAPPGEPAALALNFDRRRFVMAQNSANGDCSVETSFHYRQNGNRVWATYDGGRVRLGSLVAIGDREGRLNIRYQHADDAGRLRAGRCTSKPEILSDGRLRLHEEWQWTTGDLSAGRSIIEEVTPG